MKTADGARAPTLGTRIAMSAVLAFASFAAHARSIEMKVTGMVCANCVASVEERLSRFADASAGVYVNLERHTVAMALVDGKDVDDAALERAITEAGFALDAVRRTDETLAEIETRLGAEKPAS